MASVASFDSLPEGESVPHFAVSPLGRTMQNRRGSAEDDQAAGEGAETRPAMSSSPLKFGTPTPLVGLVQDLKKRKNLVMELLSTERIYVASLRLINDNYYQPLAALSRGVSASKVESLSTATPALSRKAIGEIFSNFVDILHLNLELLSRLEERLSGQSRETPSSRPTSIAMAAVPDSPSLGEPVKAWEAEHDSIGDLLVPVAPFLKMYSLYVKNFSSALTRIENERKSNDSFARFLKETEKATWGRASNQGGFGFGLGFQAHLLTIVQRIPRYKLLIGDLVRCTPVNHRDHVDLCKAYAVIEQVAESINDNIRQHEMVLVMLGLQRSLLGLPEPLIVPGRSLIKRATLLKACRKNIQSREFFLFNDCLIYAAPISGSIDAASAAWQAFSRYGYNESPMPSPLVSPASPRAIERSSFGPHGYEGAQTRTRTMSGPSPYDSKRQSLSLEGQQMQFRGRFNLQDCTVVAVNDVVAAEPWLRHCLEIRTPGKSFAVYAETLEVKMQWLTAIRTAREEWMSNRRTLQAEEDSIQAKRDRRRSLQVGGAGTGATNRRPSASRKPSLDVENASPTILETAEGEGQAPALPASSSSAHLSTYFGDACNQATGANGGASSTSSKPKSLKILDEYNAPVWVPDSRADRCVCCSEQFGIWRRKHHCRLCGQVVCWACSSKTFLIACYEEGEEDRPARACDTCYESVFPDSSEPSPPLAACNRRPSTGRADSEASLNTPSTPSSPTAPTPSLSNGEVVVEVSDEHGGPDFKDGLLNLPTTAMPSSRHPSSSKGRAGGAASAAGVKFPKARGIEAQLFYHHRGGLLSPQVQAATSGSGTFRLVTPRLTTPEDEDAGANGSRGGAPSSMGDYFAYAEHGQTDLGLAPRPRHPPARKKVLSAADRLSSVYGGLSSPSMTNLTKP